MWSVTGVKQERETRRAGDLQSPARHVERGVARTALPLCLVLRFEACGEGAFPVRHDASPPPRMSHPSEKSGGGAGDRAQFPAAGAAPGDAAFAGERPSPMSAARHSSNYRANCSSTVLFSWNWACSVELANAVVDERPPAMTCVTSSK